MTMPFPTPTKGISTWRQCISCGAIHDLSPVKDAIMPFYRDRGAQDGGSQHRQAVKATLHPNALLCGNCTKRYLYEKVVGAANIAGEADRLMVIGRDKVAKCGHCGNTFLHRSPQHAVPMMCPDCSEELENFRASIGRRGIDKETADAGAPKERERIELW